MTVKIKQIVESVAGKQHFDNVTLTPSQLKAVCEEYHKARLGKPVGYAKLASDGLIEMSEHTCQMLVTRRKYSQGIDKPLYVYSENTL